MTSDLYHMAYRAECDGHDRNWHRSTARSHSDMRDLIRGSEDAKRDMDAYVAAFVPSRHPVAVIDVDFG